MKGFVDCQGKYRKIVLNIRARKVMSAIFNFYKGIAKNIAADAQVIKFIVLSLCLLWVRWQAMNFQTSFDSDFANHQGKMLEYYDADIPD